MQKCPNCHSTNRQVKNGRTPAGSQSYWCRECGRKYTPQPKLKGYDNTIREQAIRLVLDGNSQRQAARHVGVSHGTVANWFKAYADQLPDELPGTGATVSVAEQDELFTFISSKKMKRTS